MRDKGAKCGQESENKKTAGKCRILCCFCVIIIENGIDRVFEKISVFMYSAIRGRFTMNNQERIEKIYQLYEQKMYWIAYSILGDVSDAEDAVQDAFVKLVRLVHKLEDPFSDRTKRFVIRTIQSTAIDRYRKNIKDRENRSEQNVESVDIFAPSHEDRFGEKQELQMLLQKLPTDEQEVIELHSIQGMSFEEISKEKKVSLAAIRKRYERGMKKLRIVAGEES